MAQYLKIFVLSYSIIVPNVKFLSLCARFFRIPLPLLPMHPPLHVLVPLTINKSHSRRVELLLVVLRALPAQCEIWVLNKDDPLFSFLSIEMTPIFVFSWYMDGSRFVDKLAHLYLLLAQDPPRGYIRRLEPFCSSGSDRWDFKLHSKFSVKLADFMTLLTTYHRPLQVQSASAILSHPVALGSYYDHQAEELPGNGHNATVL